MPKPTAVVGKYNFQTGPLVLGSPKVEQALLARNSELMKKLGRLYSTAPKPLAVAGETAIVFGGTRPAVWWPEGSKGGVLVRMINPCNELIKAFALDPGEVPADAWKRNALKVTLDGPSNGKRRIVDALSRLRPERTINSPSVSITLAPGAYEVDRAQAGEDKFAVELWRFRTAGSAPPLSVARAPKPPAQRPTIAASTGALASKARFVGTDGGPVLACPIGLVSAWGGNRDSGDYSRACAARAPTLKVGKGQALVLKDAAVALIPGAGGAAYLVGWVAGDTAAQVVQAVLSLPEKQWKRSKEAFAMPAGGLVLFDSAKSGASVSKQQAAKLAAGRYAVAHTDERDVEVEDGGKPARVVIRAVRLQRR